MTDFRNNHYVPKWYQKRFLAAGAREQTFYYLDLHPPLVTSGERSHRRAALLRWGPQRCFVARDLYTTRFGRWFSTEIERKFFGVIDPQGQGAVDYFTNFEHLSVNGEALRWMMAYMTLQRLRTPTGLSALADLVRLQDPNAVLLAMQQLRQMYGAIWTEAVWSIADASQSPTKFVVSDHPVTLYNRDCFPQSVQCRGHRDPDIRMSGTHTIFPLSRDKLLILTNVSWVRNPYTSALTFRPNPDLFRNAVFNFMNIQTGRMLAEGEVREINYVIKQRARRYIAAGEEEWLYPERHIPTLQWDQLGDGYLFMPDPRGVPFTSGIQMGYTGGQVETYDEYGHVPGQPGFRADEPRADEWRTSLAFQGEFARVFGPRRRGRMCQLPDLEPAEDSPEFHAETLRYEAKYKPPGARKIRKARGRRS